MCEVQDTSYDVALRPALISTAPTLSREQTSSGVYARVIGQLMEIKVGVKIGNNMEYSQGRGCTKVN